LLTGLKKRTRKAFGIRKKEKDSDSTGSPDKDKSKKANGAPNGYYGEIDWDRYNSPDVDDEGYISPAPKVKMLFSSSESEGEEEHGKKFKIKIKPLTSNSGNSTVSAMDELKASVGTLAISPSPLVSLAVMLYSVDVPYVVPSVRGDGSASACQDAPLSDPSRGRASMPDLDSVFGPVETPRSGSDVVQCSWVSFSEGSPARPPPPDEPAPSPPLSSSPADSPPTSPLNLPPGLPFLPADHPPHGAIPSPLALKDDSRRTPDLVGMRDEIAVFGTSPKDLTAGSFRGTPPPLPPPTYRSVMGSPGPGSGPSSPARAGTPLSAGSPIPPLPPRPSSRPKLPPGKPSLADLARPFSPPIHSWSPPPFAPLARAESTSSISSVTSLSAASTPTLGRELNLSVSGGPQQLLLIMMPCSRGPSPLTMGPQDTLPVAAAFTETISAYFKGADPTKCLVKITGEMVLSFPAGITRHFSSHPNPPVLTFTISQYNRLEQVLPNPQLLCCDTTPRTGDSKEFWVNMSSLLSHLKKVAEQKPQATYYNVDMLKYQVFTQGIQSTPLNLAVSWRGDANSTDLRIDYKYNIEAMPTPTPLTKIHFVAAVDGGVHKLQAMLPPATWNPETQKIAWKIPELSQRSENGGVGALLARFQLAEGPSRPSQLAVQFTSEGSNLSGCDFQLIGSGYRLSLVKKRFSAGKYLADN
uniref:SH3GL interacting endocytic adaptor 1 n=1 Tax=Sinocyclocheilus grahami TaxID=75366 RepID=A0A672PJG5_SINGR